MALFLISIRNFSREYSLGIKKRINMNKKDYVFKIYGSWTESEVDTLTRNISLCIEEDIDIFQGFSFSFLKLIKDDEGD